MLACTIIINPCANLRHTAKQQFFVLEKIRVARGKAALLLKTQPAFGSEIYRIPVIGFIRMFMERKSGNADRAPVVTNIAARFRKRPSR